MKKRDVIIFGLLVVLVVVFTAWENIDRRDRDTEAENKRRAEREQLEKRLADYDLVLDSLTTDVLRIVDSLKTEAAAFESLAVARQAELEIQATAQPAEPATTIESRAEPRDTLSEMVRTEYRQALESLPADLTRYERKIARQEVENTILARFSLTLEDFNRMKKDWPDAP